ncbi:MAG: hypothetical protein IPK82_02425 [Polyangiaceae bacterium]|nr:hypothetical protein [Polyangiaceae bacterium]
MVAVAGCDVGTPEHSPIDAPNVQLIQALATTQLDANGNPLDPENILGDGAPAVMPSTSLRLRFDRFLLPSSIIRQSFCVRPALGDVTTFTDCAGGIFSNPRMTRCVVKWFFVKQRAIASRSTPSTKSRCSCRALRATAPAKTL